MASPRNQTDNKGPEVVVVVSTAAESIKPRTTDDPREPGTGPPRDRVIAAYRHLHPAPDLLWSLNTFLTDHIHAIIYLIESVYKHFVELYAKLNLNIVS